MLKSAVPAVTLVVMFTAGLERLHGMTLLGVGFVTCGTLLAAWGEVRFSTVGVIMMLGSEFAEAIKMAFFQYVLGNLKFDLIEGLFIMMPASVLFLMIGIWVLELEDFVAKDAVDIILQIPHYFIAASLMGFTVNLLTLGLVKCTSGLSFKVIGQVKNAVVVMLAVLLFGNPITSIQVFGYSSSVIGFYIYQKGKTQQQAFAAILNEYQNSMPKRDGARAEVI
jgi:hypothetical protein